MPVLSIHTRAALADAVDVTARMAHHLLPLATWCQSGKGAAVFVTGPDTPWPAGVIKRCRARPTVIIVGADAGEDTDALPADWQCLDKLRVWLTGGSLMVHAAGGEPVHYRMAVPTYSLDTSVWWPGRLATRCWL